MTNPTNPESTPVAADDVLLEVDRISVRYTIRYQRANVTLRETLVNSLDPRRLARRARAARTQHHWALRDVSLSLRRGEVVGVIGRNGAGKTTLLQTLAGVFLPDQGQLLRRGKVSCLLSLGAGFNGNLTGRIAEQLDSVIAFSDLGPFIDAPVRTYSAGMRARLGFSVALLVDPDIVILDEILRVGDAAFREKAGSILDRFRAGRKAILLASHSMDIVHRHCDRVLWLDRGVIRASGTPAEITGAYLEDAHREQDRLGATG